jgi:hypothetical protein
MLMPGPIVRAGLEARQGHSNNPQAAAMQRVHKSVLVPYSARQMFDLVDDVARYPEFLPWCGGSEVLESPRAARRRASTSTTTACAPISRPTTRT